MIPIVWTPLWPRVTQPSPACGSRGWGCPHTGGDLGAWVTGLLLIPKALSDGVRRCYVGLHMRCCRGSSRPAGSSLVRRRITIRSVYYLGFQHKIIIALPTGSQSSNSRKKKYYPSWGNTSTLNCNMRQRPTSPSCCSMCCTLCLPNSIRPFSNTISSAPFRTR